MHKSNIMAFKIHKSAFLVPPFPGLPGEHSSLLQSIQLDTIRFVCGGRLYKVGGKAGFMLEEAVCP